MATERLTIRIDADDRASRALRGMQSQLRSLGRVAIRTGAALGGALAAGAALSVREFVRFEDALTGVAKTVDAPMAQLRGLADQFRGLSERIPVSTNELLRIAQLGGQLGVATENLQTFAETIAALDVATDLGAEQGSLQLARFAEVMQIAQTDFDRIGSAVVDLGNNFAVMESELVDTQQFFAGTARAAGFAAGEVLGLAAALRASGVRAQAGGSAMMVVIQEIQKAIEGANENLGAFAEVAGVAEDQFAQTFRQDASEGLLLFVEGMGRMLESGQGVNQMLEELSLNDRRVTRGLIQLASAGDLARRAVDQGTRAFAENTALAEEASRFYDRLGADLETLKNAFVNNFSEIAEQGSGQLRQAIQTLKESIPDLARVFASTLAFMLERLADFVDTMEVLTDRVSGSFLGDLLGVEETPRARLIGLDNQLERVESFIDTVEFAEKHGVTLRDEAFTRFGLEPGADLETVRDFRDMIQEEITELTRDGAAEGLLTGLSEGIRQAAQGLRGAQLGFGGGGQSSGGQGQASDLSDAMLSMLGFPTEAEISRLIQQRVMGGMQQAGGAPSLTAVGARARAILSEQQQQGPLGANQLLTSPIQQGFNQQMQQAEQFLSGAGSDAGSKFTESMGEELKRGARFAMQSLLQGLIRGRDNILDSIINIGLSIGSQLLTGGLFNVLDIASPSGQAEFAGRMVGEGLVRGLNSQVTGVRRAMGNLMSPVSGALAGAGTVSAMGSMGSVSMGPLIDVEKLGPLSQVHARRLMDDPHMQRVNDALRADGRRRGS